MSSSSRRPEALFHVGDASSTPAGDAIQFEIAGAGDEKLWHGDWTLDAKLPVVGGKLEALMSGQRFENVLRGLRGRCELGVQVREPLMHLALEVLELGIEHRAHRFHRCELGLRLA